MGQSSSRVRGQYQVSQGIHPLFMNSANNNNLAQQQQASQQQHFNNMIHLQNSMFRMQSFQR